MYNCKDILNMNILNKIIIVLISAVNLLRTDVVLEE